MGDYLKLTKCKKRCLEGTLLLFLFVFGRRVWRLLCWITEQRLSPWYENSFWEILESHSFWRTMVEVWHNWHSCTKMAPFMRTFSTLVSLPSWSMPWPRCATWFLSYSFEKVHTWLGIENDLEDKWVWWEDVFGKVSKVSKNQIPMWYRRTDLRDFNLQNLDFGSQARGGGGCEILIC